MAFCSSLELEVACFAAWTFQCVCALSEFQHRQSVQNVASYERAGSCSRHGAAKTCQRGPKGPGCSCSKMCARQKPELWGVCYESRSLVHMIVGTWCLLMSMVTCSRKCIDPIRPSVLVKVSCRLCRFVFLAVCNASSTAFEGTASGSMDWMQPFCCANMFQLVSNRLPCTCSTDTFFTKHYSRTRGAVPNMLDLRRRSSFPILFRSGMIQLATAQN